MYLATFYWRFLLTGYIIDFLFGPWKSRHWVAIPPQTIGLRPDFPECSPELFPEGEV